MLLLPRISGRGGSSTPLHETPSSRATILNVPLLRSRRVAIRLAPFRRDAKPGPVLVGRVPPVALVDATGLLLSVSLPASRQHPQRPGAKSRRLTGTPPVWEQADRPSCRRRAGPCH